MVGIGGFVAVDMVLAVALVSWGRCLGWIRNWLARVRIDMNPGELSLGETGPVRKALGWRGTRGRIVVRKRVDGKKRVTKDGSVADV